jgi:hypothetical protein
MEMTLPEFTFRVQGTSGIGWVQLRAPTVRHVSGPHDLQFCFQVGAAEGVQKTGLFADIQHLPCGSWLGEFDSTAVRR